MLGLLEHEPVRAGALTSTLESEKPPAGTADGEPGVGDHDAAGVDAAASSGYEVVLGRPQIASWLFVVVIALGVVSAISFYAGKGSAAKSAAIAAAPPDTATLSPEPPATQPAPVALPEATILRLPSGTGSRPGVTDAPLFAPPEPGKLYMQMGAVGKGMAVILAEGLRVHGMRSFVAPGPNVNIFRVLVGPLPDQEAYRRAKAEADAIDLGTFARRFEPDMPLPRPQPAAGAQPLEAAQSSAPAPDSSAPTPAADRE